MSFKVTFCVLWLLLSSLFASAANRDRHPTFRPLASRTTKVLHPSSAKHTSTPKSTSTTKYPYEGKDSLSKVRWPGRRFPVPIIDSIADLHFLPPGITRILKNKMYTGDLTPQQRLAQFPAYSLTANTSHVPKGDIEAIPHLIRAGKLLDELYLSQWWEGNIKLREQIVKTGDKDVLEVFDMYKGPYCTSTVCSY